MTLPRITLELPMPPSINGTHAIGRSRKKVFVHDEDAGRVFAGFRDRQRLYRQPHYVAWQNAAGAEVVAARPRMAIRELPAGWYCARMLWAADAPIDVDNAVKPLGDFLHWMRLTPDDRWLWRVSASRSHRIAPGRCEVTVWSLRP